MSNNEAITLLQDAADHGDAMLEMAQLAPTDARAIARLLKEQEAVEPVKQIEQNEWTVCGNCRNHLISKWIFCPYCGRAVKWDG